MKSTNQKSSTNKLQLFIIAMGVLLTLAGCKGGGSATKPTQVVKPTPTPKSVVKKSPTDLSILANHFATKKYTGDTKQYTIDDIIAPKKIISALTNTKISYIKLLRNEILARRGYVFKPEKSKLHGLKLEDIKEILQPAKWYSSNLDFIYADLTKIEIANVSFLKRLEKIDLIGGEKARQLAVVLDMDKHEINTDEAIKVYKATGDRDVLTKVNSSILNEYVGKGISIVEEWLNIWADDTMLSKGADPVEKFHKKIYSFAENFLEGDRLYIGKLPNRFSYIAEIVINTTNFAWDTEAGQYWYPHEFVVDKDGNVWIPLNIGLTKIDITGKKEELFTNEVNEDIEQGIYDPNLQFAESKLLGIYEHENKKWLLSAGGLKYNKIFNLLTGKVDNISPDLAEKLLKKYTLPVYDMLGNKYNKSDDGFKISINNNNGFLVYSPNFEYDDGFKIMDEYIYIRWVFVNTWLNIRQNIQKSRYILFRFKKI